MLKNTHELKVKEIDIHPEIKDSENVEEEAINVYSKENPSDFNAFIPQLIHSMNIEKQEGETLESFSNRIMDESRKILKF